MVLSLWEVLVEPVVQQNSLDLLKSQVEQKVLAMVHHKGICVLKQLVELQTYQQKECV